MEMHDLGYSTPPEKNESKLIVNYYAHFVIIRLLAMSCLDFSDILIPDRWHTPNYMNL